MATTTMLFCFLVLFFNSCISRPTSDNPCDELCQCLEASMNCNGANLYIIPKIPPRIMSLDLSRNNLINITSLSSLSALQHLNLSGNRLSHVEATSFQRLSNLEMLDLSHNVLTTLHPGLFSGLDRLKHVNLSHNSLVSDESHQHAMSFRKLDIETLDLSFNGLTKLSSDLIGFFSSVKTLRLSGNKFDYLDATHLSELMSNLKNSKYEISFYIDQNENELQFEDFFFSGLQMKLLNLRGSRVTDLKFMEEVVALKLDLSDNPLFIKTLNLNRHLGRTCEELYLSNVGLKTIDITFLSSFINLQILDLSRNYLFLLDGRAISNMPFLRTLDLSQNSQLSELSLDFGQSLTTLAKLNLSGCAFERIDPLITSELSSLSVLDLSHNNFQTLTEMYANIFENVRSINMSSNPLHCNCEMMWFTNWTRTEKFLRSNVIINDFICDSPIRMPIKNMTLMDFKCKEPIILNITQNITYPEGANNVMFYCKAEADPPPTLTWITPFGSKYSNRPSANRTRYVMHAHMKLSPLKKSEHEGWYECKAENEVGRSFGRTYLTVLEVNKTGVVIPPDGEKLPKVSNESPTSSITKQFITNTTSLHLFSSLSSPRPHIGFNLTDVIPDFFTPLIETSTTTLLTTTPTSTTTPTPTSTTTPTTTSTTTTTTSRPTSTATTTTPSTTTTITTPTTTTTTTSKQTKTNIILPPTKIHPIQTSTTAVTSTNLEPLTISEVVTTEQPSRPDNKTDQLTTSFLNSFENRVAIFVAIGILCLLASLLLGVLAIVIMRKRHRRRKYLLDKRSTFLRTYSSNGSQPRRHRSNSGVMTTPLNSTLERPRNGFDILLAKEKGLS